MTSEESVGGLVRLRQVQEVHRLLPQTLVANFLFSAVIAAWFASLHFVPVLIWFTLVASLSGFALLQIRKLASSRRRGLSKKSIKRSLFDASIMGFSFISVPAWLLTQTSGLDFAILIALLTGVSWGGAVVLATVLPASLGFIAISHVLIVGALLSSSTAAGQLLLAFIFLSGAYTTLRCVRLQSRSFDIGTRQKIELEQQGEVIELLLRDFEEQTSDWLWEVDADLRYRPPSKRFVEATGLPVSSIEGAAIEAIFVDASNSNEPARVSLREQALRRSSFRDLIITYSFCGQTRWWSFSGKALLDADGGFAGYRGVCTDVSLAKEAEMRIVHLAHHDGLTDLPNRIAFRDSLARALKQASSTGLAVLSLDLDGFKGINDRYGHPAGDALLVAVAQRLRTFVQGGNVMARFGGDEFLILDVNARTTAEVEAIARSIVEGLSEPIELMGERVTVGVCIGVAFAPADGETVDELLKNADAALYRAKAEGRGTFRFFSPDLDRKLQERQQMVEDLRQAIGRNELILHYQPFVISATEVVSGYEALLRWRHPRLGMIAPDRFIPLAEESGLIVQIGAWVIEQACLEAVGWPVNQRVSVNISPVQFQGRELPKTILMALAKSGLAPSRLEVEITETVLIDDADAALDLLRHIRAMGVGLALDDFGTGYSSLSYLRRFPFDKVKIDRSFVEDLESRRDNQVIVRAIGDMARGLGMTITAEGVETASQAAQLRASGCEELQGFLFSRPKPAHEHGWVKAA